MLTMMVRILMLISLLSGQVLATDYVRYVNTGSAGGDGTTDAVSGENAAYATFQIGEDTMDGVLGSGDTITYHLNRTNDGGPDGPTTFGGWNAGATIYIIQDDFPEDGKPNWNAYYMTSTNDETLFINGVDCPVIIDGLQAESIVTGTGLGRAIYADSDFDPNVAGITINRCIIKGVCSGTGSGRGIYVGDGSLLATNLSIYGFKSADNPTDNGFSAVHLTSGANSVNVYNCTLSDNYGGIRREGGTVTAINCAIFNNTDDIYGTVTLTYCAGDDTDFDSGTGNVGWANEATDWAANFTDYSNYDFTVKNTDADIYHAGTDLGLGTDIAGNLWDESTPSIGAFEYEAATPPAASTGRQRVIFIN